MSCGICPGDWMRAGREKDWPVISSPDEGTRSPALGSKTPDLAEKGGKLVALGTGDGPFLGAACWAGSTVVGDGPLSIISAMATEF